MKYKPKSEILKRVREKEENEFYRQRCLNAMVCHLCGSDLEDSGMREKKDPKCFNEKCSDGEHNKTSRRAYIKYAKQNLKDWERI